MVRYLQLEAYDADFNFFPAVYLVCGYTEMQKKQKKDAELQLYDAICTSCGERADRIFALGLIQLERKTESFTIGQSNNTPNVPECYSATELRHLCKNDNFVIDKDIETPLGFGVFGEKIVPLIVEISKNVGCKYLYLFAADGASTSDDPPVTKLVKYYKNDFKFCDCDSGMKFVKPDYDNYCYGLVQEVSTLERNRNAVWEEFFDV